MPLNQYHSLLTLFNPAILSLPELRYCKFGGASQGGDADLDELLKAQHQAQEHVAEEMISFSNKYAPQSISLFTNPL